MLQKNTFEVRAKNPPKPLSERDFEPKRFCTTESKKTVSIVVKDRMTSTKGNVALMSHFNS
jgi:hypothetical protein